MANLSLNPMATTNALGSFGVQSDGYIQGVALDDPANRFNLAAGTVAATETKPLWGGLPVAELLPGTSSSPRGSYIRRAVSVTELEGFTVFNQAHNGLTTPQSPVPLYASGMRSQIINSADDIDLSDVVVSSSLPVWLTLSQYMGWHCRPVYRRAGRRRSFRA